MMRELAEQALRALRTVAWPARDRLVITDEHAALWRRSGLLGDGWKPVAACDLSPPVGRLEVPKEIDALLREVRGPAHLDFPDHWTRLWLTAPPQGARSLADLRAAAMVRFEHLYGEPLLPGGWSWQAEWHAGRPFVCCALSANLQQALRQACARSRVRLASARPHLLRAVDMAQSRGKMDAVLAVDLEYSACALRADGRIVAVRLGPEPRRRSVDLASLKRQVDTVAFQQGLPAPLELIVFDLSDAASAPGTAPIIAGSSTAVPASRASSEAVS